MFSLFSHEEPKAPVLDICANKFMTPMYSAHIKIMKIFVMGVWLEKWGEEWLKVRHKQESYKLDRVAPLMTDPPRTNYTTYKLKKRNNVM